MHSEQAEVPFRTVKLPIICENERGQSGGTCCESVLGDNPTNPTPIVDVRLFTRPVKLKEA